MSYAARARRFLDEHQSEPQTQGTLHEINEINEIRAGLVTTRPNDEGVYGTSHIGIGTSSLLGGTVKAKMHYDVIMWSPTLTLDGEVVLRDGIWLMNAL